MPKLEDGDVAYADALKKAMAEDTGFPTSVSRLLDHLYIGGENEAKDLDLLRSIGVTHVINCAGGYVNTKTGPDFYGKEFTYMSFNAEDETSYNIMQHFQPVYEFIETARLGGGKVLIHCLLGVNRSGVLAIAYCMLHGNMGPITAAMFVKKSRNEVMINEGFQKHLVVFARERGMLKLDKHFLDKE